MLNRITAAQAVEAVLAAQRSGAPAGDVLRTVLVYLRGMIEADDAYIAEREGNNLVVRAADGVEPGPDGITPIPLGEGIDGLAALRGEPVVVNNASAFADSRDPFGRRQPIGAALSYPLIVHGEVIGVVAARRWTPGRFGGADLWWVNILGGLAAVVMENETVRRTQERRARQAEVLLDVVSQSGGSPEGLIQRISAALNRDLGVARVDVLMVDDERGELRCLGAAGSEAACAGMALTIPLASQNPLVHALRTGQPHAVADLRRSALRGLYPAAAGLASALVTPIPIAGRPRGVLVLAERGVGAFGPEDQALALVVAARVGVLLEEADLRQRRASLDRAEADARARQEFVGIVSHELKTPVAVIQAYTDLLLRRAERAGQDANVDVLKRIGEQSERMLHMIEQMLDLQRLEVGQLTLETSAFDLAALARRVSEAMGSIEKRRRIEVVADGQIPVVADRRRIEEVLQNLVENAAKFSPEGSTVTVKLERRTEDGATVVSVVDRGRGLSADEAARVFERFYQGSQRPHEGRVGLGLGLYISREIVRRHGGEIWVESEPGQGSTFSFSLPAGGPDDSEP